MSYYFIELYMQKNIKTIGVIGGGQLGKMLIEHGIKWNQKFSVLESVLEPSICNNLTNQTIRGSLHDPESIRKLADISDVITIEIENINVDELLILEESGKEIIPSPKILQIIQDKGKQKIFLKENNLPVPPFTIYHCYDEIKDILSNHHSHDKFVIKKCVGGYDGHGVMVLSKNNYENARMFEGKCLFEEWIECQKELSIIVAKDRYGNIKCYPVVEMKINDKHMLDYMMCPAEIHSDIEENVKNIAISTINKLNGIGVFAIEMFLTKNNTIYINEISPRCHNSGHYTIEGCKTSQYEQLLRIILGYPLGSTEMIRPSITMNLLGPKNYTGPYELQNLSELMMIDDLHIHHYGKQVSKPDRKLGHITILLDSHNLSDDYVNNIKKLATVAQKN